MATSGWQSEKTWYTYSSNVRLIGNINITGLTHSGNTLRVQGQIKGGARGTSGYYFSFYDYTSYAQPEGGSKIALGSKGKQWKVGAADTVVNFDVTLSNVAASSTSKEFSVNFYGPDTNSVKITLKWTLTFDASGSAPTGPYATYDSSTWNSITFTTGVASTGGLNIRNHAAVFTGSANKAIDSIHAWTSVGRYEYFYDGTQDLSHQFVATTSNASSANFSPIEIKGLLHYKLGVYANNSGGEIYVMEDDLHYLPPAPSKFSYTDPGGEGTKVFPVVFTGDDVNNFDTYDSANLTRTVRYKVNDAADWTYVVNASVAAVDDATSFNVSIPGSQSAVIEGWMSYHGMDSEVKTLTLYNGNAPSRVYAPVNGNSKLVTKLYASVGGQSVEIVKLYGSVNGESKAILG